jgi:GT2 family glycosyltransferase
LNRAARVAQGDVLFFLHADVRVPPEAIESLERELKRNLSPGGNFDLTFDGDSRWSRFFTWVNRLRRRFGVYYGDSGVFARREVFEALGGFREIPVMDDYEFVRRLERKGKTLFLSPALRVSDRRWRERGVLKTLLSWVIVQGLYSLRISPNRLVRWYTPVRDGFTAGAEPRDGNLGQ